MYELINIVIPKMKAQWQNLAYAMKYEIGEVNAFDKDGRDLEGGCKNLFTNWLTTGHGPTPKTYETLLKYIKKVNELTAAREEIEKELIKGNDKGLMTILHYRFYCSSIRLISGTSTTVYYVSHACMCWSLFFRVTNYVAAFLL